MRAVEKSERGVRNGRRKEESPGGEGEGGRGVEQMDLSNALPSSRGGRDKWRP